MAEFTDDELAQWNGATGAADLTNSGFDREGNLTLTFTVHPGSKYDLIPVTDIKGRAFTLTIKTASSRVFAGRKGMEEARRKVRQAVGADDD